MTRAEPTPKQTGPSPEPWYRARAAWRFIGLRYLPRVALLNLVWEIAQLPLYTLWHDGTPGEIAYAVAHCTAGDAVIGGLALLAALALLRPGPPSTWPLARIAALTTAFAVVYTLYSEWLNTSVRQAWAYSELMPVLPVAGTGLAPLAQWLTLPLLALLLARRAQAVEKPGARPA